MAVVVPAVPELATTSEIPGEGWYPREVYPQQKPFRWMNGWVSTLLILRPQPLESGSLSFDVKCPAGDLTVNETANGEHSQSIPSWVGIESPSNLASRFATTP